MSLIKKGVGTALLVMILLLLLSSPAAAQETPSYVYYQRSDNAWVMVDYAWAVEKAFDAPAPRPQLYDALIGHVLEALRNYRAIVVETEGGLAIDYSRAVKDGKTYLQAVSDSAYHTARPDPHYEMYLTDPPENAVLLRSAEPVSFPAWFDQANSSITWSDFANSWVIDVVIIGAELPENYTLDHIHSVYVEVINQAQLDGGAAKRGSGEDNNRWRRVTPGDANSPFELEPGGVKIMINNLWYW